MIANMNEKGRQTKLLAAIAVLAMVVCVFAIAMPSDDVDAAVTTPDDAEELTSDIISNWTSESTGVYKLTKDWTLTADAEIPAGVTLYTDGWTIDTSSYKLTVNGTLYVNGTNSSGGYGTLILGGMTDTYSVINGKVVVDTDGILKVSTTEYINGTSGYVDVTAGTIVISETEDAEIGFTATLTENSSVTLNINQWYTDVFVIEKGATLTIASDITWNGTVTNSGTITINNNVTLTNSGTFTNNGTITNNGTFTNNTGATLTNNGTITGDVTNNGTLYLNGTVEGKVINSDDAKTVVGQNGTATEGYDGKGTVTSASAENDDNTGFQGQLNFNLEISTSEYLSGNYVIAEGYTLTIKTGGSLDLNGYQLIVYGTLVIENGGYITGIGTDEEGIVLTAKGTIENAGVIGKGANAVSVIAFTNGASTGSDETSAGTVTLQNVTGISLGLVKTVADGEVTYQLAFSGTAVRNGTGTYKVEADGAIVNGDLTIGSSVTFSAKDVIVKGVTVTVNGIADGNLELLNGSTVIMNGQTSDEGLTISAYTGEYKTSDGVTGLDSKTEITVNNVRGLVVEVASETYMSSEGISYTEQKMLVSGTLAKTTTGDSYSVKVSGNVYVEGELYIPEAVGFSVTSGMVTVTGQISSSVEIIGDDKIPAGNITGTAYSVGTTDEVFYVTGFDQAYAAISSANSQEITVYGDLELTGEYTIAQGQTIILDAGAVVEIAENGSVTIDNGGYINGTIYKVEGVLTVIYGGTASAPTYYAVKTTTSDNDVIYSGLAYALNNASEGETVNLVQSTTVDGSLTIPTGVTLDVNSGATLTVSKNLTVNGTLLNHGSVSVGRNVTVSGTVDNTESQSFNACTDGDDYDVTVSGTGSIIFSSKSDWTNYNGAYYTYEGETIFTTLSNAADTVSGYDVVPGITVIGTYSEDATIEASGDITIDANAIVSVTEIVLDGCTLTIDGTFTGAVTGQSGEDGSTVTSTVKLGNASEIIISNGSAPNDANITVWTTAVSLPDETTSFGGDSAGSETMTVSAGVITLGSMTVNAGYNGGSSIVVASGAEIVIPSTSNVISNGMTVAGTITVEGEFTASSNTVIEGTMDIAVDATVNVGAATVTSADTGTAAAMTVTGTVNIEVTDEDSGSFCVKGTLIVGERPATLGATTTGSIVGPVTFSGGYIIAYSGADMSGAVFNGSEGVDTEYYVNDVLYMTVYAKNTTSVTIGVDIEIDISGLDTTGEIEWVDADGNDSGSAYVGTVDAVYATFNVSNVSGVISVGNGLTMYIDGLTIDNFATFDIETFSYAYQLSVGTHTVTIAANAGYDISGATITFNGQTIASGDTIEVTADMIQDGFVLAASGAVPSDSTVVIDNGDSGMGLTDYLLIILVVLIVIMAVIVALRMMRS